METKAKQEISIPFLQNQVNSQQDSEKLQQKQIITEKEVPISNFNIFVVVAYVAFGVLFALYFGPHIYDSDKYGQNCSTTFLDIGTIVFFTLIISSLVHIVIAVLILEFKREKYQKLLLGANIFFYVLVAILVIILFGLTGETDNCLALGQLSNVFRLSFAGLTLVLIIAYIIYKIKGKGGQKNARK